MVITISMMILIDLIELALSMLTTFNFTCLRDFLYHIFWFYTAQQLLQALSAK